MSEPRVWFNGDEVPGGVWVLDEDGEIRQLDEDESTVNGNLGALVEVIPPDWSSVVDGALETARCTHKLREDGRCDYWCGLDR